MKPFPAVTLSLLQRGADPAGKELAGTSASAANQDEFGLGPPGEVFVTGPLASFAPLLGGGVGAALARYRAAPASQQAAWAESYLKALEVVNADPDTAHGPVPGHAQKGMAGTFTVSNAS